AASVEAGGGTARRAAAQRATGGDQGSSGRTPVFAGRRRHAECHRGAGLAAAAQAAGGRRRQQHRDPARAGLSAGGERFLSEASDLLRVGPAALKTGSASRLRLTRLSAARRANE